MQGTFHFHSTYSHDGRSSLAEIAATLKTCNLSFCIMTEHFEDLDPAKCERYIQELARVSAAANFVFIPGVEVNLNGIDTIFFPIKRYEEIGEFVSGQLRSESAWCKVIAHPSKYRSDEILTHLERYRLDGIELWNQQADGSHIPPLALIDFLTPHVQSGPYRYFFGCDLHCAGLTVSNVLSLPCGVERTPEAIAQALLAGNFTSRNLPTGIEYRNDLDVLIRWAEALHHRTYYRGRFLWTIRRCLRSIYRVLPRDTQHSLNNVKNFVRNKV
jgi:hypothetical protein